MGSTANHRMIAEKSKCLETAKLKQELYKKRCHLAEIIDEVHTINNDIDKLKFNISQLETIDHTD